jgi:hypothetical protein
MQIQTQVRRNRASTKLLHSVLDSLRFSLASYLQFAPPWSNDETRRLRLLIARVAHGHLESAQRIVTLLTGRRSGIRLGAFSKRFTALNDLAVDFVAKCVVEDQEQRLSMLQDTLASLTNDKDARTLIHQIMVAEREHTRVLPNEIATLIPATRATVSPVIGKSTQEVLPYRHQRHAADVGFTRNLPQRSKHTGRQPVFTGSSNDAANLARVSTTARTVLRTTEGTSRRGERPRSVGSSARKAESVDRCRSAGDSDIARWLDEGGAMSKSCCSQSCE